VEGRRQVQVAAARPRCPTCSSPSRRHTQTFFPSARRLTAAAPLSQSRAAVTTCAAAASCPSLVGGAIEVRRHNPGGVPPPCRRGREGAAAARSKRELLSRQVRGCAAGQTGCVVQHVESWLQEALPAAQRRGLLLRRRRGRCLRPLPCVVRALHEPALQGLSPNLLALVTERANVCKSLHLPAQSDSTTSSPASVARRRKSSRTHCHS
jgi:hypothetical protein